MGRERMAGKEKEEMTEWARPGHLSSGSHSQPGIGSAPLRLPPFTDAPLEKQRLLLLLLLLLLIFLYFFLLLLLPTCRPPLFFCLDVYVNVEAVEVPTEEPFGGYRIQIVPELTPGG